MKYPIAEKFKNNTYIKPIVKKLIPASEPGMYKAVVNIANNPGISGYHFIMTFDNTRFTPVYITQGNQFGGNVDFASNLTLLDIAEVMESSEVSAFWLSPDNNHNNGELFTVLFRENPEASQNNAEPMSVSLYSYDIFSNGISISRARGLELEINDVTTNLSLAPLTAELELDIAG